MIGHTGLGGNYPEPDLCIIDQNDEINYTIEFIKTGVYELKKYMDIPFVPSTVIGNDIDIPSHFPQKFFVISNCEISWCKIKDSNAILHTLCNSHQQRLKEARL